MKKIKKFASLKLLQPTIDVILSSAEALLIQKGVYRIDFGDLQNETGLSKAIIYSAFNNIHELFLSLAKKYFAKINQKLASDYLSDEFSSSLIIDDLVYFFKSNQLLLDLLSNDENNFEENTKIDVFNEYLIEKDKFFSLIEQCICKIAKSDTSDNFRGFGLLFLSNIVATYRATHFSDSQIKKYKTINPDFSVLDYDCTLQIIINNLVNTFIERK